MSARICKKCRAPLAIRPGPAPFLCPDCAARKPKSCKWCGVELPPLKVDGRPPDYCRAKSCRWLASAARKRAKYAELKAMREVAA